MSAVELDGVERTYSAAVSVGPLTFEVPLGVAFGLIGSNGAGKTTVMRLMTGLEAPSAGRVRLLGERVVPGRLPGGVAAMIEEPRFYRWLSGFDNLRAFSGVRRLPDARVRGVLSDVGLEAAGDRPFAQYSQGMRQRLGIARVLLTDAQVMIFDEPTNGLDPVGIRWLRQLIHDLLRGGRTVVLSSHLLHEVQQVCSSYLMLAAGRVIAQGRVDALGGYTSLEDVYYEHVTGSA